LLKEGSVIIEPTSGNTGVGLAMVAAVKQMKLVLVMPESMSIERRRLMTAYGAQLELTPRAKGMPGAIARAQEMVAADPKAWMPSQFDNPANVAVHEETTAQEILADLPDVDVYITGVGTGGHLTVRLLLGALSGVGRPFGRSNQEEVQILDGHVKSPLTPETHTQTHAGGGKGPEAEERQHQDLCRGAQGLARHQRRLALAAPDPGGAWWRLRVVDGWCLGLGFGSSA